MSVLFKALQRAEKVRAENSANRADASDTTGTGSPGSGAASGTTLGSGRRIFVRRGSRSRSLVRGLGLGLAIMLAAVMGALLFYSDDLEDVATLLLMGDPPAAPWQPPPPLPPTETPAATSDPDAAPVGADAVPASDVAVIGTEPDAVTVLVNEPDPADSLSEVLEDLRATLDEAGATADGPTDNSIAALMAAGRAAREAQDDTPPEPRSVEDVVAERARTDAARAVAPVVTVERPEARRVGAPEAVTVTTPTRRTQDTVSTAYRALLRGEYHSALTAYDTALEEAPSDTTALLGRAAALHKLRRLDEAQEAYERVLAREPSNREAMTNLLAIIGEASPRDALRRLEALERTAPDFTPVVAQIGLVYGQLGMVDQAVSYLNRAVTQDPDNLLVRFNLAVMLDRSGDRAAAARAYRGVLETARATGRNERGTISGVSLDAVRARLDFLTLQR